MQTYEYTVVAAPTRSEKVKGAKSGADRFAATLSDTLNEMAQAGWEYVRAEALPVEERSGLTSRTTVYHNVLVFRRPSTAAQGETAAFTPVQQATPRPFSQPMRRAEKPVEGSAAERPQAEGAVAESDAETR